MRVAKRNLSKCTKGDHMELGKGYVTIVEGGPQVADRPVAIIHLDFGQSVREMKEPQTPAQKLCPVPKK
jgi:hypothetical protein